LRTQFAYIFSKLASPYGDFLTEERFVASSTDGPVTESIFRDLDRSKEPYVLHFRKTDPLNPGSKPTYPSMPVWAAVEVLSFGTLSRCLERCRDQEVPKQIAQNVDVAWSGFTSQVKSFVYLRNRCAHHSRLWNHSVLDAPHVPNNVRTRAKRTHGQFGHRSIYVILVALDNFLEKSGLRQGLLQEAEDLIRQSERFCEGIKSPVVLTAR